MADIEDFETGENTGDTPRRTTGEMSVMVTPVTTGVEFYFEATAFYRGTAVSGGTRVVAGLGEPTTGKHKVEFTLAEADLPSGTYPLPGNKIKNVLYAMQPGDGGPYKNYHAKNGTFVLINRFPELYLAGHFSFETDEVENKAYSVRAHKFEIKGQY